MQVVLVVLGFILFIGLVLIHEWGHFIAARRNGVEVEEFGLGLPPRAWRRKLKSGMIMSLNWLPLGGFVKMKGEHDSDERPGSFGAASLRAKTKIMLAGVSMNLLAAVALLMVLAWLGIPRLITPDTVGEEQFTVASDTKVAHNLWVDKVTPSSPAEKAGLAPRDFIKSISSSAQIREIKTQEDLPAATKAFAGQQVQLLVKRSGKEKIITATLRSVDEVKAARAGGSEIGYLGITTDDLQLYRSTWSAPIVALGLTKQITTLTFEGLAKAMSGLGSAIAGGLTGNEKARQHGQTKATEQVGGPVAIVAILWSGGSIGINFMIFFIALISLALALFNVLPVPALDGGRLAMILASRGILRRPLSKKVEERLVGASMALLLILFVLITSVDVRRFF